MTSSKSIQIRRNEFAWKMWRVADVPNDKNLQLATLESLCQYLGVHLPVYLLKHVKRSISWVMKFPDIEAANKAERHHHKTRKARKPEERMWRIRAVPPDFREVLHKVYGYGPLSPPGIGHFLRKELLVTLEIDPVVETAYSDLPGWREISAQVIFQQAFPELRHPYIRQMYNQISSAPPPPPTATQDDARSRAPSPQVTGPSAHPDYERQQTPELEDLKPAVMDLSQDFVMDFELSNLGSGSMSMAISDYGRPFFDPMENNMQFDDTAPDFSDLSFRGTDAQPGGLAVIAPNAITATLGDAGAENELFDAFFNMD
ncbi:hypothetical protein FRB90_009514 [Tulasnella sp. 427]|nr:hypothetical protein FRB90_009514 [Tulasnella sp. 427]